MEEKDLKAIIESLLFASGEPLTSHKIKEVLQTVQQISEKEVRRLVEQLGDEYNKEEKAFGIEEVGGGFLLKTRPEFALYVEKLGKNKRKDKLSPAAGEVLAIIAYRQPISRLEIEAIRGVDCSGTIHHLEERGLIHETGRLDAPGRPQLLGTTPEFLLAFGLNSLDDLPQNVVP